MDKTIFVSGNFNILHPGHLRILRFAKELGSKLVVGVHSDMLGGDSVHVPEALRLENVTSNIWVDEAFLVKDSIAEVLNRLRPDIVVKGKEYENQFNTELEILDLYGGKLIFSSGEVSFSSIDLINKVKQNSSSLLSPDGFLNRHKINKKNIKSIIEKFSKKKVCVIGDTIVDEYITCDPLGMSQEDPTIVVTPIDSKKFIGGAAIVAAHASSLGSEVSFFSVSGIDKESNFVTDSLDAIGVNSTILKDESRPTTLKQRYRSKDKTLLRVSHLHQAAISSILQENLLQAIKETIQDYDIVIFSDFNYGCLPERLVKEILNLTKKKKVILAADSQSSSQTGDILKFKDMNFIFPTEHEARLGLRNYDDGLAFISHKLSEEARAENVILKLGEEGMLLLVQEKEKAGTQTDRLQALNSFPKDVAGAGDSLMVASLLSYSCGANIWESAYIGSLAAAIQVGRVGNIPISIEEIKSFI